MSCGYPQGLVEVLKGISARISVPTRLDLGKSACNLEISRSPSKITSRHPLLHTSRTQFMNTTLVFPQTWLDQTRIFTIITQIIFLMNTYLVILQILVTINSELTFVTQKVSPMNSLLVTLQYSRQNKSLTTEITLEYPLLLLDSCKVFPGFPNPYSH